MSVFNSDIQTTGQNYPSTGNSYLYGSLSSDEDEDVVYEEYESADSSSDSSDEAESHIRGGRTSILDQLRDVRAEVPLFGPETRYSAQPIISPKIPPFPSTNVQPRTTLIIQPTNVPQTTLTVQSPLQPRIQPTIQLRHIQPQTQSQPQPQSQPQTQFPPFQPLQRQLPSSQPFTQLPPSQPFTQLPPSQPFTQLPPSQPFTQLPPSQPFTQLPPSQPFTQLPPSQPFTQLPPSQPFTQLPPSRAFTPSQPLTQPLTQLQASQPLVQVQSNQTEALGKVEPSEVETLISQMKGINISALTLVPLQVDANIEDILQKESDETDADFEARTHLTLKLSSLETFKLNNTTTVTLGFIMMKKAKLGLTYDPDIEKAVNYVMALLQLI